MSQVVRGRKTKELDAEKEEKASIKYALLRSFLCLKNVVFSLKYALCIVSVQPLRNGRVRAAQKALRN